MYGRMHLRPVQAKPRPGKLQKKTENKSRFWWTLGSVQDIRCVFACWKCDQLYRTNMDLFDIKEMLWTENSKKKPIKIGFWLDGSLAPSPSDPLTLFGANRSLAPKSEHKCMEGCTWDPSRQNLGLGRFKKKLKINQELRHPQGCQTGFAAKVIFSVIWVCRESGLLKCGTFWCSLAESVISCTGQTWTCLT